MDIHEMEIIKAALEGDIILQKKSEHADHPAFKEWLKDTEKLLKKVSIELMNRKAKQELFNKIKR